MYKYLVITFIFAVLFSMEVPKLMRKKEIKELIVFSFLGLIGYILSIIVVLESFI